MSTSRGRREFASDFNNFVDRSRSGGSRKYDCVKGFQDWDLAVGHDGTNWYLLNGDNAGAIVETRRPCDIEGYWQQYLGEVGLENNIELPPGLT